MSLIRETGRLPKSPIFSLKACDTELENTKQMLKEKDVIIYNNKEKIQELENYVAALKEQKIRLENQLTAESEKYAEEFSQMPSTLKKYEKFISNITAQHETLRQERHLAGVHLANLEMAFVDLLQKYERLKTIIIGYQQNQDALVGQIEICNDTIRIHNEKYNDFKNYANEKLSEANAEIEQNNKKHISELAKVKSKVLESKVRIRELEKTISIMSANANIGDVIPDTNNKSMFTPLRTYF